MSDRMRNWQPGVPAAGLNGADIDDATVTNAKLGGSITSDKLSKPYAIGAITAQQVAPAAVAPLHVAKMTYAGEVVAVSAGQQDAGTGSTTGIIDVSVGNNVASQVSVFGTGSKVAMSATDNVTFTGTPSGALGVFAAGQIIAIDVDSATSGTKAGLFATVEIKTLLIA